MTNLTPSMEVKNYDTLNKFLMETITKITTKRITVEEAGAISQIADKIVKNNLTKIMYTKMTGTQEKKIEFFG